MDYASEIGQFTRQSNITAAPAWGSALANNRGASANSISGSAGVTTPRGPTLNASQVVRNGTPSPHGVGGVTHTAASTDLTVSPLSERSDTHTAHTASPTPSLGPESEIKSTYTPSGRRASAEENSPGASARGTDLHSRVSALKDITDYKARLRELQQRNATNAANREAQQANKAIIAASAAAPSQHMPTAISGEVFGAGLGYALHNNNQNDGSSRVDSTQPPTPPESEADGRSLSSHLGDLSPKGVGAGAGAIPSQWNAHQNAAHTAQQPHPIMPPPPPQGSAAPPQPPALSLPSHPPTPVLPQMMPIQPKTHQSNEFPAPPLAQHQQSNQTQQRDYDDRRASGGASHDADSSWMGTGVGLVDTEKLLAMLSDARRSNRQDPTPRTSLDSTLDGFDNKRDQMTPYIGKWRARSRSPLRDISTKIDDVEKSELSTQEAGDPKANARYEELLKKFNKEKAEKEYYKRSYELGDSYIQELKQTLAEATRNKATSADVRVQEALLTLKARMSVGSQSSDALEAPRTPPKKRSSLSTNTSKRSDKFESPRRVIVREHHTYSQHADSTLAYDGSMMREENGWITPPKDEGNHDEASSAGRDSPSAASPRQLRYDDEPDRSSRSVSRLDDSTHIRRARQQERLRATEDKKRRKQYNEEMNRRFKMAIHTPQAWDEMNASLNPRHAWDNSFGPGTSHDEGTSMLSRTSNASRSVTPPPSFRPPALQAAQLRPQQIGPQNGAQNNNRRNHTLNGHAHYADHSYGQSTHGQTMMDPRMMSCMPFPPFPFLFPFPPLPPFMRQYEDDDDDDEGSEEGDEQEGYEDTLHDEYYAQQQRNPQIKYNTTRPQHQHHPPQHANPYPSYQNHGHYSHQHATVPQYSREEQRPTKQLPAPTTQRPQSRSPSEGAAVDVSASTPRQATARTPRATSPRDDGRRKPFVPATFNQRQREVLSRPLKAPNHMCLPHSKRKAQTMVRQ